MTRRCWTAITIAAYVLVFASGGCPGVEEAPSDPQGKDSSLDSGSDDRDATAPQDPCAGNRPPAANAGAAISAIVGDTIELSASGSTDADGDALAFAWSQASGPDADLSEDDASEATFVAAEAGTYQFELVADDGCASDTATVEVTVEEKPAPPPPADEIEVSAVWSNGTQRVYGEIAWTLPSGDRLERLPYYDEQESGVSAISEAKARATEGLHQISFRLVPDGPALADITFRVHFLDYAFEVSRARFAGGDRHAISLEVKDGCVTELANSWRLQAAQSPVSTDSCAGERNIRVISEWADATSKVFGEIHWVLPSGDELSRTPYYNEVINGVSALSEVPERAADGVHLINFRVAGDSLALVDARLRVEFLNYVFETTRERIAGTTSHTIALEVRDGCVTELANSWRLIGGDLSDDGTACSPPEGVRIASVWADADARVYGNLIWTLPDGSQIRQTAYYNEVINGVSALSEVPEQVADGLHEIRFGLAGNRVTLADVEFRVEFLGYEFEAARDRMAGETEHTIQLDVRNGRVIEIGNTW